MSAKDLFFSLTPDRVLDAVENASGGIRCTGFCQSLNSFENRVYEVELDEPLPLPEEMLVLKNAIRPGRQVVKFYRPGRWTKEQIQEEHDFLLDLVRAEVPVVAPLSFPGGGTLRALTSPSREKNESAEDTPIYYTLFPKVGGRAPSELDPEGLEQVGRLLGRIHSIGAQKKFSARPELNPLTMAGENLEYFERDRILPPEIAPHYFKVAREILGLIEAPYRELKLQRVHGDCHLGNLLWIQTGGLCFFLDFDDARMGPKVQDFWLLLPQAERNQILEPLLEGYEGFSSFDRSTLKFIEPLRALRFIHYSAWLSKRWEDPAFPIAFPHFGSVKYWNDEFKDLEAQAVKIRELFS